MKKLKTYITEIKAINPRTGQLVRWRGEEVIAKNHKEARKYLDTHEKGYCHIIGILEGEERLNDGTTATSILELDEVFEDVNSENLIEDIYSNLMDSHN